MASRLCGCCGATTNLDIPACEYCGQSDQPVDILTVASSAEVTGRQVFDAARPTIQSLGRSTMPEAQRVLDSKTILFSLLMAGAVRVPAIKSALDTIGMETVVSFMAGVGVWLRARTGKPLTLPNVFGSIFKRG